MATLDAFADDPALADFKGNANLRQVHAHTFAARIAESAGPVIDGGGRCHHVNQFRFIGRRHDDHAGQAGEIGDVVAARMGGAVLADQSRPVDGKAHRKFLQGHVMDDLVIGPLQEGGIDRAERLEAFRGKPRRKGYRMLFGDPHIEHAFGEMLGELVQAGARRHRRRDGNNLLVLFRFGDQRLGKDTGVGRRIACGLLEFQGFRIKARDGMVVFLVGL